MNRIRAAIDRQLARWDNLLNRLALGEPDVDDD